MCWLREDDLKPCSRESSRVGLGNYRVLFCFCFLPGFSLEAAEPCGGSVEHKKKTKSVAPTRRRFEYLWRISGRSNTRTGGQQKKKQKETETVFTPELEKNSDDRSISGYQ